MTRSRSGREIVAQITSSRDELSGRRNLVWERGEDDLDAYFAACLELEGDGTALLVAYDHDPDASVHVIMDGGEGLDERLDRLLSCLGVADAQVMGRQTEDAEPRELFASTAARLARQDAQLAAIKRKVDALSRAQSLRVQGFDVLFSDPRSPARGSRRDVKEDDLQVAEVIALDIPRRRRAGA